MKLFLEIIFREVSKIFRYKNYFKFLIYVILYSGKRRYKQCKVNLFGKKIIIADGLSFVWQFHEIFVEEYYKFNAKNNSPLIIDCGANIGLSAIYFKLLFPAAKVIALEPDDKIYNIAKNNINALGFNDVELIKKAVWIDNSGVKFFSEGADGSTMFSDKANTVVSSVRLKDLLSQFTKIDMLKMDIEGAEVNVIEDCEAELAKIETLFIEYHSYVDKKQELDKLLLILTNNGFRYFIKPEADRRMPFINRLNKNNLSMDLQLNIFAYK